MIQKSWYNTEILPSDDPQYFSVPTGPGDPTTYSCLKCGMVFPGTGYVKHTEEDCVLYHVHDS
jgi:hypothetical protein